MFEKATLSYFKQCVTLNNEQVTHVCRPHARAGIQAHTRTQSCLYRFINFKECAFFTPVSTIFLQCSTNHNRLLSEVILLVQNPLLYISEKFLDKIVIPALLKMGRKLVMTGSRLHMWNYYCVQNILLFYFSNNVITK